VHWEEMVDSHQHGPLLGYAPHALAPIATLACDQDPHTTAAPAAAAVSLVSHTRLDSQASAMALVPRWWARSPFAFATR